MFLRKIPVIVSCLALIGLAVFFLWPAPVRTQVRINDKVFDVEVVSTDKTTAQGLSGREKLEDGQGMLFVFDRPDRYSFWMKGMSFPIDIIYVNENKIADMALNMPAPRQGETPATYVPRVSADKVLEFKAGTAQRYGWNKGDEVLVMP